MNRKKPPFKSRDLKLWKKVTESLKPLDGKPEELEALIESLEKPASRPEAQKTSQNKADPIRKHASKQALQALKESGLSAGRSTISAGRPPLQPIDRKERRRIAQGRSHIEARLDLHGMTQKQAHSALFGFLRSCHLQGFKHVLIITGKGSRGDSDPYSVGSQKGILRRVVPKWLMEPEIRSIIVGFEEAHRSLGGAGALHIRLRSRNKRKS